MECDTVNLMSLFNKKGVDVLPALEAKTYNRLTINYDGKEVYIDFGPIDEHDTSNTRFAEFKSWFNDAWSTDSFTFVSGAGNEDTFLKKYIKRFSIKNIAMSE